MRVAVIDIGSNTTRLLIADIHRGQIKRRISRRVVTSLAKGILNTSTLSPKGKIKTLRAIKEFTNLCALRQCQQIFAIGTSALRESSDGADLVREIETLYGIKTEVLTGRQEAELTYLGIADSVRQDSPLLLIDVGGGSTEWVLKTPEQFSTASMPIGAIKIKDHCLFHDPPTKDEFNGAKDHIHAQILRTNLMGLIHRHPVQLIATGGTATTLACIDLGLSRYNGDRIHLHRIDIDRFNSLLKRLKETPMAMLSLIKGLDKKRAEIIVAGAIIIEVFMELSRSQCMIISDYGLIEGYLRLKAEGKTLIPQSVVVAS